MRGFAAAERSKAGKIAMKRSLAIIGCALSAAGCNSHAADVGGRTERPATATSLAETPERCTAVSDLMKGNWPDPTTRVLQSTWQTAGSQVKTPMGSVSLPEHCEITAALHERVGVNGRPYAIHFRVRLPAQWNERFLFEGGGGTEGELGTAVGFSGAGLPPALARGYAVVAQDAGHDNAIDTDPARGGAAAFGFDPQARADYGGAALKPVAEAAKAVIRFYYGHPVTRSYFVGCSKGGQEGLAFAERYPDTFDGIVAADPGMSLPRAAVAEAWDTRAFASLIGASEHGASDPALLPKTFSDARFSIVRDAILTACDADDGVRDGITANFAACTWRRVRAVLERKICSASAGESCLTAAQIDVLGRVLTGAKNAEGQTLYADWPVDAGVGSAAWRLWKIGAVNGGGPDMPASFPGINVTMGAQALAAIFTTPPTAVMASTEAALAYALSFNFERDAPKIYAIEAPFVRSAWTDISARSPDLEAFRAHGGKLIIPHGASDPVFSLNDTLAWYREVDAIQHGRAASFLRVFPVPGMAHCAGGPATDQFDAFGALVFWVEMGVAPESILAKAGPASPWPDRTRPLCRYPKIARYSGRGSIEDAASFRCE
jgi:Tannase and feruloyl esterase